MNYFGLRENTKSLCIVIRKSTPTIVGGTSSEWDSTQKQVLVGVALQITLQTTNGNRSTLFLATRAKEAILNRTASCQYPVASRITDALDI